MLRYRWQAGITQALILTAVTISVLAVVSAQTRSSNNYQLQSDSINVGGAYATSTSYQSESTMGEAATGPSDSTSYALRAGYQQMQTVFISLDITGDVVLSPGLPGITGGESNGSTTATVVTDSPSGYQLSITAENDPAMQSAVGTIADYDAGAEPDFTFTTGGGDAHFGFSPEGVDIVSAFLDNGIGSCNTGTDDTALACWDGLGTAPTAIAEGAGANQPNGATTSIKFRVGIGSGAGVSVGVYTATTTVTALPL